MNGKTGIGIGIGAGAVMMLVMIIVLVTVVFPNDITIPDLTEQSSTQSKTIQTIQERADQRLEEKKKEIGWGVDTTQNNLNSAEIKNQELEKLLAEQERQNKYELELQKMRNDAEQQRIIEEQEAELFRQQLELEQKKVELERQALETKKGEIEALARINPVVSGIVKGTLNIYFAPVPNYASEGVRESVQLLSNGLDGIEMHQMTIRVVSNPNNADITVGWLKDFGSTVLGHAIFKSVVEVGLGEGNCFGDWQAYNALTVNKILWHELGHAFGYNHSVKASNIMYSTIESQFTMDVDKSIDLDEGDYYTMPFCKSGSMNYYLTSDSQSNGFHAYVLTSTTTPTQFLNGGGQYYPSCSTEEAMSSFGKTCKVGNGDKLVIYNRNDILKFSAITVNVQVVDLNVMPQPDFVWDSDAFEYDLMWLSEVYDLFH